MDVQPSEHNVANELEKTEPDHDGPSTLIYMYTAEDKLEQTEFRKQKGSVLG